MWCHVKFEQTTCESCCGNCTLSRSLLQQMFAVSSRLSSTPPVLLHKHFFSSPTQFFRHTAGHLSLSNTLNMMPVPLPFLWSLPFHVALFHLSSSHVSRLVICIGARPSALHFAHRSAKRLCSRNMCFPKSSPAAFLGSTLSCSTITVEHLLHLPQSRSVFFAFAPPVHTTHHRSVFRWYFSCGLFLWTAQFHRFLIM